jgi:alkanesulfonate monooxygenase SsuD/methylene tetrahydromethanopterin reductase-like flavin-dependent oxidoreductase (luciferase family)
VAEELAMLDVVSGGRVISGQVVGTGNEFFSYNVNPTYARERFHEAHDLVVKAWTEPGPFAWEGTHYRFRYVNVWPKPYQQPHPPIRVAATSPDTFPAIGAQGFDLFAAVRTGTLSELAPNLAAYREAYAAGGHPGKGGVFLRVPLYVSSSFDQAVEDTRDSIMGFYRQLGAQLEASASEAGARAIEQRDVRGRRMQTMSFEDVLQEKVIVGTPEMVISRLRSISDELGLDGILAELNCGGQVPREGVVESLRLLCKEVMPAFA